MSVRQPKRSHEAGSGWTHLDHWCGPVSQTSAPRRRTPRNQPLTDAQRDLVERWFPLLVYLAGKHASRRPDLREEIHSEVYLAACKAARTFDPGRGFSFATHVKAWVAGAVLDLLLERGRHKGDPAMRCGKAITLLSDTHALARW